MQEPKIIVHATMPEMLKATNDSVEYSPSGFFNFDTNEIHMLEANEAYRFTLEHELAHHRYYSEHPLRMRFIDTMISISFVLMISACIPLMMETMVMMIAFVLDVHSDLLYAIVFGGYVFSGILLTLSYFCPEYSLKHETWCNEQAFTALYCKESKA